MSKDFTFIDPGKLVDGDLELVLVGKHEADPVKKYVPWYDFEMRKDTLTDADLENVKTHGAVHNAANLDTILKDFRRARSAIVKRLEVMRDDNVERTALHPRLQTLMRPVDLAFFFAEHDDHHLANIRALLRKFG